jgi:bifunctional ADP-heptose synthase (sugar kinase/adenylyltransferase)
LLPAFYESDNKILHPAVLDTTGAGNAFLGAFGAKLAETGDPIMAAASGTVAASFVVEQFGLPRLTTQGSSELWNGQDPDERLQHYNRRRHRCIIGKST